MTTSWKVDEPKLHGALQGRLEGVDPALDTDQPTGHPISEVSRLAALARRRTEVGSYQARGGGMLDFQVQPGKCMEDLSSCWGAIWSPPPLSSETQALRQECLQGLQLPVLHGEAGTSPQRIQKWIKGRSSIPGPRGRCWSILAALPRFFSETIASQVDCLKSGRLPFLRYNHHDLYFIPKAPTVLPDGQVFHCGEQFRDISVGDTESRAAEAEMVAPCREALQLDVDQANAGWVPGRDAVQPIVDTASWTRRHGDWGIMLLDFQKAFPTVILSSLWAILYARGMDPQTLMGLKMLHVGMTQTLWVGSSSIAGPRKTDGLWTGSCASPTLLLLLLDVLIRMIKASSDIAQEDIDLAAFADDFTIWMRSVECLLPFQRLVSLFGSWSGVKPSLSKTLLVLRQPEDQVLWRQVLWDGIAIVRMGATLGVYVGHQVPLFRQWQKAWVGFQESLMLWRLKKLPASSLTSLWNLFLLPKLLYLGQFFAFPEALGRTLLRLRSTFYRLGPTFPSAVLNHLDWIAGFPKAPLLPGWSFPAVAIRLASQHQAAIQSAITHTGRRQGSCSETRRGL